MISWPQHNPKGRRGKNLYHPHAMLPHRQVFWKDQTHLRRQPQTVVSKFNIFTIVPRIVPKICLFELFKTKNFDNSLLFTYSKLNLDEICGLNFHLIYVHTSKKNYWNPSMRKKGNSNFDDNGFFLLPF